MQHTGLGLARCSPSSLGLADGSPTVQNVSSPSSMYMYECWFSIGVRAEMCPDLLHTSTSYEGSIMIEAIATLSAYLSSYLSSTISKSSF